MGEKVGEYSRSSAASKGKGKRAAPGAGPSAGGASSSSSSAQQSDDDPSTTHFEIYRSTWQTPGWRDFHRRMQIFALFFIEGASYIHEDEGNWEWLTLWQRWKDEEGRMRWAFVGYTRRVRAIRKDMMCRLTTCYAAALAQPVPLLALPLLVPLAPLSIPHPPSLPQARAWLSSLLPSLLSSPARRRRHRADRRGPKRSVRPSARHVRYPHAVAAGGYCRADEARGGWKGH